MLENKPYNRGLLSSTVQPVEENLQKLTWKKGSQRHRAEKRVYSLRKRQMACIEVEMIQFQHWNYVWIIGINWPVSAGFTVALHFFLDGIVHNFLKILFNLLLRNSCMAEPKRMWVRDTRHGPSYHTACDQTGSGYRARYIGWNVLEQMQSVLPGYSLKGLKQKESYGFVCTGKWC